MGGDVNVAEERAGEGPAGIALGAGAATGAAVSALRPFVVESRRAESDVITSFVLRPLDGGAPFPHVAGQHLTLVADIPGAGRQKRSYTISSAPNGATYRISVKREPQGRVSSWLHERAAVGTRVEVAAPAGAFVLPADAGQPVVMVSAGVGLTPMVAMVEAAQAEGRGRHIRFVHCTQSRRTQAFQSHLRGLAAAWDGVGVTVFHTRPEVGEVEGSDYDVAGRLTTDWLAAHTPMTEAAYFVCGPLAFMRDLVPGLLAAGVAPERVHYEFFGAMEDLFGAPSGAAAPAATAGPVTPRRARVLSGFARERLGEALLDSPADAVIASDAGGDIVLWNAGAERIFGFTEEEALGASLDIIIPEPFRARHWEGYRETVATGQSRYGAGDLLAVPGLHRDGRRLSIEFTIVLVKEEDGTVSGMIASVRDVTARFEETKALKKRLAALEASAGEGVAAVSRP